MTYEEQRATLLAAYRRIVRSAHRGQGTRLSPLEVQLMVTIDDAIPTAVSEDDYNQEANRASGPEFP